MKFSLRLLYLYLFSFVGLIIVVIGSVRLVDLGIKTFIFPEADRYEIYPFAAKMEGEIQPTIEEQRAQQEKDLKRNKQRELSGSVSMILVGVPLYAYHWRLLKKEN